MCRVWRPTVRRRRCEARIFGIIFGPTPIAPATHGTATGSQALPSAMIAGRGALCQVSRCHLKAPDHLSAVRLTFTHTATKSQVSKTRPPCPNVGHVGIFHTTRFGDSEPSFSSRAGVARQFETDRLPRQFETVERACRSLQAFKMSPSAQGSWHRALFQALQRPSSHPCGSPPG